MTLDEQNQLARQFFDQCVTILNQKGQDYTPDGESLKEVRDIAREAGITPAQVLWVYMRKHISAIHRYVKEGRVESESITSRLLDVANYAVLLHVLNRQDASNSS